MCVYIPVFENVKFANVYQIYVVSTFYFLYLIHILNVVMFLRRGVYKHMYVYM